MAASSSSVVPTKPLKFYLSTLQPPTASLGSCFANFFEANSQNLIINKVNRLEIFTNDEGSLTHRLTVPLYGKIVLMIPVKQSDATRSDLLLVTTEKYDFCVMVWNGEKQTVESLATGNLNDRSCRPSESGQLGCVEPLGRFVVLHLFQGLLKVIPIDSRPTGPEVKFKDAYNVRIEDLQIVSMDILITSTEPTLVVLHETVGGGMEIKSYILGVNKCLTPGPFTCQVDSTSHTVICVPKPRGGVLIVAEEIVQYYKEGEPPITLGATMFQRRILSVSRVDDDGFRYFMGDHMGNFMVLLLFANRDGKVESIKIEHLGVTSISSSITYLDNGRVYIGSKLGDSQIIQLSEKRLANGSYLEVVQSTECLAPVTDLVMANLDSTGQSTMLACSGAFKDGHISIIRKGLGVNSSSGFELSSEISGFWPLNLSTPDAYFVLSTLTNSQLMQLTADSLEAVESPVILQSNPSLYVGQYGTLIFQVSPTAINYGCCTTGSSRKLWIPQAGAVILAADSFEDRLGIILSSGFMVIFTLTAQGISQSNAISLPSTPSCINLGVVGTKRIALVGTWIDYRVLKIDIDEKDAKAEKVLELDFVCRSVRLAHYDKQPVVLAGLGNGSLVYCDLSGNAIKVARIGQSPVRLIPFGNDIVALADRPTLIRSKFGRPNFLSIGLESIEYLIPISANKSRQDFIASLKGSREFIVGSLESTKNGQDNYYHSERLKLGETARRISLLKNFPLAVVGSVRPADYNPLEPSAEFFSMKDTSVITLIDPVAVEVLHRYELPSGEVFQSLLVTPNDQIVVGTAILGDDSGEESQKGRLLTFKAHISSKRKECHLSLENSQEVNGAVYALNWLQGRLIASVNGCTSVFVFGENADDGKMYWKLRSNHFGQIIGVCIDTLEDSGLLSIGDMMRSGNILRLDKENDKLFEIARDYHTGWTTCVRFVDDEHLLLADDHGNVSQLVKTADPSFVTERLILDHSSGFNLGSLVNVMAKGCFSEQGESNILSKPLIYATAEGSFGLIAMINDMKTYEVLATLQSNILALTNTVGFFDHTAWRSFCNDKRTLPDHADFIDGDIIQRFLTLPETHQRLAVLGCVGASGNCERLPHGRTFGEIVALIDSLSNIS